MPATRSVPASGRVRVATMRTKVVLPAPLGPSKRDDVSLVARRGRSRRARERLLEALGEAVRLDEGRHVGPPCRSGPAVRAGRWRALGRFPREVAVAGEPAPQLDARRARPISMSFTSRRTQSSSASCSAVDVLALELEEPGETRRRAARRATPRSCGEAHLERDRCAACRSSSGVVGRAGPAGARGRPRTAGTP